MVKPESSDPCPTTHRSDEPVGDISEYELQRLDNIRRNEEFLKTLGFEAVKAKKESSTGPKVSRKRKSEDSYFPTESIEYREPSRRSRRIQQQEAELIDGNPSELPRPPKERRILEDIDVEILIDDENTLRTKITAPELQAFIEERSAEHYELIGNDVRRYFMISLVIPNISSVLLHRLLSILHIG